MNLLSTLKHLLPVAQGEKDDNTGAFGETLAATWLQREAGFHILARNWRASRDRRAEIDLVANDGRTLVFIEVKTRSELAIVTGRHSVNRRKRMAMRRACDAYLKALPKYTRPPTFRFDVVEVALPMGRVTSHRALTSTGEPVVRHFQNVPLFRKFYRR